MKSLFAKWNSNSYFVYFVVYNSLLLLIYLLKIYFSYNNYFSKNRVRDIVLINILFCLIFVDANTLKYWKHSLFERLKIK